jgi:hypothetical protein
VYVVGEIVSMEVTNRDAAPVEIRGAALLSLLLARQLTSQSGLEIFTG